MKTLIHTITIVAFLMLGINFNTVQAQNMEPIQTKSKVINASADDVWARLRQIDKVEEIIPDLVTSSWLTGTQAPGVGCTRSCTAPGAPKGQASYTETILEYSDAGRYYTYDVKGIPAKGMVNTLRVVDLGYNKCMVVWSTAGWEYVDNPQMSEEQFISFLDNASNALLEGLYKLHNTKS